MCIYVCDRLVDPSIRPPTTPSPKTQRHAPSHDSEERHSSICTSTPTVQPHPKRYCLVVEPNQREPTKICYCLGGGGGGVCGFVCGYINSKPNSLVQLCGCVGFMCGDGLRVWACGSRLSSSVLPQTHVHRCSLCCTCPVEQCPTEYFHDPTRVLRGISGVLRPMHRLATADSSAMMLICFLCLFVFFCGGGGGVNNTQLTIRPTNQPTNV